MKKHDLLLRFLLGGSAVALSYLVTVISPWKILGGIFAAFPAVMLTAVLMMGISSGSKKAANIAKGSVFGMIGGIVCVVTVLLVLQASGNWMFSIISGFILWLGSSFALSEMKEHTKKRSLSRA